jgi:branched-chain amino acid transport system substrate-binding protein
VNPFSAQRLFQRVAIWQLGISVALGAALAASATAQKAYDPGASDTQIKIGSVSPYTGSAKEYAAVARAESGYFAMINDGGGIHGRQIVFLPEDSASTPGRTVELTRKLVEDEGVLLIFSSFGTEGNLQVRGYLNEKHVPQLFVQSSATAFNDPAHFPWTMGFFATFRMEGAVYAKWILQNKPAGRIALLYADDDTGREYRDGIREGLGDRAASMILKEATYGDSDASLEAQIAELKKSGADVFLNMSVGRHATEAIRAAYAQDWHPVQFIPNASLSIAAFLDPAGLAAAKGIICNARSKGWWRPEAVNDPAVREFLSWMKKYDAQASVRDQMTVAGYERAQALVEVLRKCGDNLTRANVMKQAASLDLSLGMLRPGIRLKTSASDYQPIKDLFLIQFDGQDWQTIGPTVKEPATN